VLAVAIAVAAARLVPVGPVDVSRWALLLAGSVIHVEATRGIERLREAAVGGGPYVSAKGLWIFAAVLVLPPPLTAALIAVTYAHSRIRVTRRVPAYKTVFSAATAVVSCAVAGMLLAWLDPAGYPGYPSGPAGLAAILAAGAGYWFTNYALIAAAITASDPAASARAAPGAGGDQLVCVGFLGLGVATAGMLACDPWSATVLLVTVLGLHRALLVAHLQTAANTDAKTGLATAGFWHRIAEAHLARAHRTGAPLAVLMIDLDDFKALNDTHGHLVGDRALAAVADALRSETRPDDLVGRFGGDEFVIALPDTDLDHASRIAHRIRARIAALAITPHTAKPGAGRPIRLSCSVGVAAYPHTPGPLDTLLVAADTALYQAKNSRPDNPRHMTTSASLPR